jgi:hypothetical protein
MARKALATRSIQAKTQTARIQSQRTAGIITAMDLATTTRGMIQFLDDALTGERNTLQLAYNSVDGLSSILQIIDSNLLGIIRAMDPDQDPLGTYASATA